MRKSFQEMDRLRSHRCSLSQTTEIIIKLQRGRKRKEKKFKDKVKYLFVSLPTTLSWLRFTSSIPPIKKNPKSIHIFWMHWIYFLYSHQWESCRSSVTEFQKKEHRHLLLIGKTDFVPIHLYHTENCQTLVQCSMVLARFFPARTWL